MASRSDVSTQGVFLGECECDVPVILSGLDIDRSRSQDFETADFSIPRLCCYFTCRLERLLVIGSTGMHPDPTSILSRHQSLGNYQGRVRRLLHHGSTREENHRCEWTAPPGKYRHSVEHLFVHDLWGFTWL